LVMNFLRVCIIIFLKDLRLEIRSRYGINTILAFVAASLMVVLFALKAENLHEEARSGLIWIIVLFASLAALPRTFVAETDQGTFDLLRLHFPAVPVFTGKLLYNFVFTVGVSIFTLFLYLFLLGIRVEVFWLLMVCIVIGSLGLSAVSTLLAALVAQSTQRGSIFSVLGIPLLIPLILILGSLTHAGFFGFSPGAVINDLMALIGYAGATVTAGSLLFDFVWDE
jgi:heme exporter protein B